MDNRDQHAVIGVREERARIGGVEVAKKTVIAATDEGVPYAAVASSPSPALPCPQHVIVLADSPPSSKKFSCLDCCFRCESGQKWYSLNGKGFCLVLLLLLGYLIFGVLLLALWLVACTLGCGGSDRN